MNVLRKIAGKHVTEHVTEHVTQDPATTKDYWTVSAGAVTYEGMAYVPDSPALSARVTALHCDNPTSGHFSALKAAEFISQNIYWPALPTSVRQYIAGCEVCHRINAARRSRYDVNLPMECPSQPREGVTKDLFTDLTE
jgi:hypothetical protein